MVNDKSDRVKDFVVVDIENPNVRCNSICSVAALIIKGGKLCDTKYSLIDPEDRFDRRNVEINGIDSSLVQDAPTLKSYWSEIRTALSGSIIVGHNITYDLRVISKSLERYDIEPPEFRYIDTLALARQHLKLDSYSLTNIASHIGFSYKAHDALEDAKAAWKVFEYIDGRAPVTSASVRTYSRAAGAQSELPKASLDAKLESNINDLYGIIRGIAADGVVNAKEVACLRAWADENSKYKVYEAFRSILRSLDLILADGVVDDYERRELEALVENITSSKLYTETTLAIQVLEGILKGIRSDNEINAKEVAALKRWLDINDYLSGVYPYDKVCTAVRNVLADGVVTEAEKAHLMKEFSEILDPVRAAGGDVDFSGKTFCLTGDFKSGSKADVSAQLTALGGIEKKSVTRTTDYVIAGSLGSDAWKYGSIGGKIARAQELIEKGAHIRIIGEDDLSDILQKECTG